MRIARWIPKATNTHSDCALHIAFPLQQRLHGRASMLCYTYIACLVWYDGIQDLLVGLLILGVYVFQL
jgi:hypothetical protein